MGKGKYLFLLVTFLQIWKTKATFVSGTTRWYLSNFSNFKAKNDGLNVLNLKTKIWTLTTIR